MKIPYPEYTRDVELCRSIHQRYGKSFYLGTLLLGKEERDATCILYAFFRFPDEYVDTYYAGQKDIALQKLNTWNTLWKSAYAGNVINEDTPEARILRAARYVFKKYSIPFEYSQAFLAAMVQDTHKERYATYHELEAYMYGSAAVVGLMMTYILCAHDIGFTKDATRRERILAKARALGEAFQMTNFLRDVGEDMALRGRIYLPLEDMRRYNVSEKDIQAQKLTPQFIALMRFEIERTNALYKEADEGIEMLPARARKGIHTARILYSKIIPKIEKSGYDVFSSRKHLSLIEKIGASLPALIK